MNWFTKKYILTKNPAEKEKYFNANDFGGCCEHCEADHSLAAVVSYENDSFGRESYVMCQACADENETAEDEEEVFCHDCKTVKKRKDTIEWRWYDFYPAQGDVALVICKECCSKETHQKRVKKDRQDAEAEDNYYRRNSL